MATFHYIEGDATEPVTKDNRIIVHCCNDIGAFGAGVALEIAKKWPHVKTAYRNWIDHGAELGQIQLVKAEPGIAICNLIGQRNTKNQIIGDIEIPPIRYEAVYEGFVRLRRAILAFQYKDIGNISLHMPRMGCGLAGGNWDMIHLQIDDALDDIDIDIYVYDFVEKGK